MLGDICPTHSCTYSHCGCTPQPCAAPQDNAECSDYLFAQCLFWGADPIPGTPIVKTTRGTEIVQYLLARIASLEARVSALETS